MSQRQRDENLMIVVAIMELYSSKYISQNTHNVLWMASSEFKNERFAENTRIIKLI
jgi:hypothetical protein